MRTSDKAQKEEWAKAGIKVTAVRDDEEGPIKYWRANLRKKSIKSDGEKADPPKVINGKMQPVEPNTIGNGSKGNVRIFQYDYKDNDTGVEGKACVLMGVQLTTHILYTPKPNDNSDDFGEADYAVVDETPSAEAQTEKKEEETPSVSPSVSAQPKDQLPEEEF